MNIPRAIENLIIIRDGTHQLPTIEWKASCALGIEALKRIEDFRITGTPQHLWCLPGETAC